MNQSCFCSFPLLVGRRYKGFETFSCPSLFPHVASARSEDHFLEWQTCILLFILFCSFVPVCSFAEDVIHIYYESDEVVCEDVELQAFVKDIYVYGMRGVKASGKV